MRRSNGTWYYYPMNGRRSLSGRGEARLTANSSTPISPKPKSTDAAKTSPPRNVAAEDACERDKERRDSNRAGRFDPFAIKDAYKRHKNRQGASEKKGVKPVMHVVVGVSPEWLGSGVHDRDDPRVKRLLNAAIEWANAELGGTFAARYDVDERGGGVVDVFCAPVREYAVGRGRTMRRMVAPAKALRELGQRRGRKISYSAMQDAWAEWANRELGDGRVQFQRGRPKAETRAENLSPEDYKRSLELAADRERDGPWRELVGRIVAVFDGGGKGRSGQRQMVEWLHRQQEGLGSPRGPDRIAADLDLLTEGKLPEHECSSSRAASRRSWIAKQVLALAAAVEGGGSPPPAAFGRFSNIA